MTYVSDRINGISAGHDNQKAAEEGGAWTFHNANLFDLDEDIYGNLIDESTGSRIDNSSDNGLGSLAVRSVKGDTTDVLGRIPKSKRDRRVDDWLKEHDPEFINN